MCAWDKCALASWKAGEWLEWNFSPTHGDILTVECGFAGCPASTRFCSVPRLLQGSCAQGLPPPLPFLFLPSSACCCLATSSHHSPETPLHKPCLAVKLKEKVKTFILMNSAMKSHDADHTTLLEILCLFLLHPLGQSSFLPSTMASSSSFLLSKCCWNPEDSSDFSPAASDLGGWLLKGDFQPRECSWDPVSESQLPTSCRRVIIFSSSFSRFLIFPVIYWMVKHITILLVTWARNLRLIHTPSPHLNPNSSKPVVPPTLLCMFSSSPFSLQSYSFSLVLTQEHHIWTPWLHPPKSAFSSHCRSLQTQTWPWKCPA